MKLFIGIDGGGSKTECAVGDEHNILGRFTAGTCKIQRVGKDAATASLRAALQGAFYAAKVGTENVQHTSIGIAGSSQPGVADWVRKTVGSIAPGGVTISGDHIIAHEAAFHGKPGVLVISGTGSIVYGRNEAGKTLRAGGWGPVVSDEGSGEWIGRNAVNAALLGNADGEKGALFADILKAWEINTADDIIRVANSYPPPNFAALFPFVVDACNAGDPLALEVLQRGGDQLARIVLLVMRQLWPENTAINIATTGGAISNSERLRAVVEGSIRREWPRFTISSEAIDPVQGALYIARRAQ
jgi:N-acetylglucosamine kinase-like BadF-type ATPase